jgi:ribonuclease J
MSFNFAPFENELLFVPLGGSNEIGMNLNLYRYQGKWIMIDCGMGFADSFLPGISVLLPNLDAFLPYKKDLVGLVLTHAHEDHIGAVQFLWPDLQCPIYATAFTAAMLRSKLTEEGLKDRAKITEVKAGQVYDLAPFKFEMVPITHSIPEMHAVALRTPVGTVMHTGDWKLDINPLLGPTSDEATLKRYGDEGVLAMVCDSTNVFVEGESGSESDVRDSLTDIIRGCTERVVVATFASNVARLQSVIYAALGAGRVVALSGKSLWRVTQAAKDAGYLRDIPPFLSEHEAMKIPRDKVAIICTGCQGEPLAALSKIARGDHPAIRLAPGDTVIFSSRSIPGNETAISWTQNRLVEQGMELITDNNAFVHVSGHPARMELERMYQLVRPAIAVPVHGEARHIREHAKLATHLQIPETVQPSNGAVILLKKGEAKRLGSMTSGYVAIDGSSFIDSQAAVIRTRRKIRDEGFMAVSLVLSKTATLASNVKITAPGCLDVADDASLIAAMIEEIEEQVEAQSKAGRKGKNLEESIRGILRRVIRDELGKKPVIDVLIHQL